MEIPEYVLLLIRGSFWRVDINDAEWMIDQDVHFFITCHKFGVESD